MPFYFQALTEAYLFLIVDLMDSINKEELITTVLQPCFPQAENIKIRKCSTAGNQFRFTSYTVHLEIEYLQNQNLCQNQLLLKIPVTGRSHAFFEQYNLYKKEIETYGKMLPRIDSLLENKILPIHFYTTDSGIFVLEDLSVQGYRVEEKHHFFNLQQCHSLLKAMAEFHGASYKVQLQNPDILNDPIFDKTILIEFRHKLIDTWQPILCELLQRNNEAHLIPRLREVMLFLKQDDDEVFLEMNRHNFAFVVLNHGDYRKDNLLLKYDDQGQVENVKIVDFQTCWWSSPVHDFLFFIIQSVQVELVEQHFDNLVDLYLQHLNKILQDCTYTYLKSHFLDDFENQKVYMFVCFLILCTHLHKCNQEEAEDTVMLGEDDKTPSYSRCLQDELFVKTLLGWMKYCEKISAFDAIPAVRTHSSQLLKRMKKAEMSKSYSIGW